MTRRYAMKDEQWAKIEDLLPGRAGSVGVTAKAPRRSAPLASVTKTPRQNP